ncbi:uncharacterized mitochondrial protein AtMg00810-like [Rutidosis leptorrhynchoides]|uniref:uncharacterized mitochondrial protein AtMg00810-like n=1 Tax=Rutidosis leptorrhynchoides TaxID=125765 RepID=UPI003A9A2D64
MTDLGPLNYFLGISVTRDSSGMFLSQRKYATEVLECADMIGCKPCRTPVDTNAKLKASGSPVSDPTLYRSLAGALQYLTFIRPDISYADTLDLGLQLFASSTTSLVAYSDPDWAGCPTTRRSTSGYCVFLGNNLLSWSSKRQHTPSRSSAEAKYRGVANAVAETCWLWNKEKEIKGDAGIAVACKWICGNGSKKETICRKKEDYRAAGVAVQLIYDGDERDGIWWCLKAVKRSKKFLMVLIIRGEPR